MSFLASSIFGHEFVNYRKNMREADRQIFSYNVRNHFPGMIPVVIDSVDQNLSLALNKCDSSMPEKMWKYGKEYTMSVNTSVDEVLKEINKNIKVIGKKLILGLENGTLLKGSDILGQLYKKHKNNKDQILYLLLTQEKTIYGYILSILRYLGILPNIKSEDKIIVNKDKYDIKELQEESHNARIDYLYEINNEDHNYINEDHEENNYINEDDEHLDVLPDIINNDINDLYAEHQNEYENSSFNHTFYDTKSYDDDN